MKCLWITIKSSMIVSAMLGFASFSCAADKFDIGKNEYMTNCASCHGTAGKGDGPSAETLKSRVTDLTVLSRNNGGVFPVSRVYEVIDGRQQVKAHGVREMPVWGKDYSIKGAQHYDDYPYDPEAFIRGRILALIDYLNRMQSK